MQPLAPKSVRVLLIDDHAIMRSGLRLLIESQPGLSVVGEASSRADALAAALDQQPDVIILDLALPGTDGLDLIPELLATAKGARILILTGVLDADAHTRAMRLGAMGVVLKEKAPEVLIKAVLKVHAGELWLDRAAVARLFGRNAQAGGRAKPDPEAAKIATLTGREREIVTLIGEGLRNKQVAERLFISEGTVRNHLTSVFGKLDVADRFELMMYAYRHELAKPIL